MVPWFRFWGGKRNRPASERRTTPRRRPFLPTPKDSSSFGHHRNQLQQNVLKLLFAVFVQVLCFSGQITFFTKLHNV